MVGPGLCVFHPVLGRCNLVYRMDSQAGDRQRRSLYGHGHKERPGYRQGTLCQRRDHQRAVRPDQKRHRVKTGGTASDKIPAPPHP